MSQKNELIIKQVKVVINYIQERYIVNERKEIIDLILKRYKNALYLLENDQATKDNLNVLGGVRAYMDSYSDYNNPLLKEMNRAEKLIRATY